jgi:PAS domain S-box-containing protein
MNGSMASSHVEALFDAMFDGSPDAVAVFTIEDFPIGARIVYVNAAFERLSGNTRDQLLGHSAVLLAGARPDFDHVQAVIRATKGDTLFASTRKYRPDGVAYDVDMWLSPLRDESGVITHYLLRERDTGRAYGLEQLLAMLDVRLETALAVLDRARARTWRRRRSATVQGPVLPIDATPVPTSPPGLASAARAARAWTG